MHDIGIGNSSIEDTWIHELFQGTLVSTTKCLNCETVWKVYLMMFKYLSSPNIYKGEGEKKTALDVLINKVYVN